MTIREHFQGVFNRIKNVTVVVAIVFACFLTWCSPKLTKPQYFAICFLFGIAIGCVLLLVMRRRFLCPRCSADLRKLRSQETRQAGLRGRFGDRQLLWVAWNACPKCGVSFDDEYGLIAS